MRVLLALVWLGKLAGPRPTKSTPWPRKLARMTALLLVLTREMGRTSRPRQVQPKRHEHQVRPLQQLPLPPRDAQPQHPTPAATHAPPCHPPHRKTTAAHPCRPAQNDLQKPGKAEHFSGAFPRRFAESAAKHFGFCAADGFRARSAASGRLAAFQNSSVQPEYSI